jgi:hypothetical protein
LTYCPAKQGNISAADVTIERIGDLISFDLTRLQPTLATPAPELEPMR